MAEELKDPSGLESGGMESYEVDSGAPTVLLTVNHVRFHNTATDDQAVSNVSVEFRAEERSVPLSDVREFLEGFSGVGATPEQIADIVRGHLKDTLNVEDVFVTVESSGVREGSGDKKVHVGGVT
jgi:hypothetical protein